MDVVKFKIILDFIQNANNLSYYNQRSTNQITNKLVTNQLSVKEGLKQIVFLQEQITRINYARIDKIKKLLNGD
jgi:hypothetical protein